MILEEEEEKDEVIQRRRTNVEGRKGGKEERNKRWRNEMEGKGEKEEILKAE